MGEEIVRNIGPAGIDIAYERFGDPAAPPLLLIMGCGAQGSGRPYVQRQLVDAHHQPRVAVLDRRVSGYRDVAVAVQT